MHRRKLAGSASRGGGGGDEYETEVLEPSLADDDEAAAAREFFARLDAQLNKVNQFYQRKEQEFLERGRSLRRQMDILADLRAASRARDRDDPSVASASASASGEYTCSSLIGRRQAVACMRASSCRMARGLARGYVRRQRGEWVWFGLR